MSRDRLDHGAVHQLHRARLELDDMLGRFHRLVKGREVTYAQDLVRRDRLQFELQTGEKRQRTFRTDQQACQVARLDIHQFIDIVTTNTPQQLREAPRDFIRLALTQFAQFVYQLGVGAILVGIRQGGEPLAATIGQHRIDRAYVVYHVAVTNRARAATVVARHTAEGGTVTSRHIDRVEQPMGFEPAIELIEHQPRFDPDRT